jgi:hypothetical protein
MKDKLKTICYVFPYNLNTCLTFIVSFSWSFICVLFHVITWLLSLFYQDYIFHAHVLSSFDPSTQCLHRWSRLCWCMSPQKLLFCYHLPTRGWAGVKLGDADTFQMYLYFLMLHACSYTISLVFCYTSWCFYAFSGTNLLTRWHSASSLFSAVFVFQKTYTGNILGIGRNKSRTSYYLTKLPEDRRGDWGGVTGRPHNRAARPSPWPRPLCVRPLWSTSDAAPSPIKTPRQEKPKYPINFPETHRDPPSSPTRDWEGPEALPGALVGVSWS